MNNIIIDLPAGLTASLDWQKPKAEARRQIENGKRIIWNIELGLFNQLAYPFSHQSQFLSLKLSLEHFKTDIWPSFKEDTTGVLLYRGPPDYSDSFAWDDSFSVNLSAWLEEGFLTLEEFCTETDLNPQSFHEIGKELLISTKKGKRLFAFFCRDVCVEYLHLLTSQVPDEIPLFVSLSETKVDDPTLLFQLMSSEKYERIHLLEEASLPQKNSKIAFCLPLASCLRSTAVAGWSAAIKTLHQHNIAFKVIPEISLITEWDGLDYLLVASEGLAPLGIRKLLGFCAAGGVIVALDKPLGLPQEELFAEWVLRQISDRN